MVQPAVERAHDRHREHLGEEKVPPFEMRMDDVEVVGAIDHLAHRRHEVRPRIATEAQRPHRDRHGLDMAPRDGQIAAGECRDVVTAIGQLGDELVDDPFCAAVALRRHGLHRRRDLGDAQGMRQGWAPRSRPRPGRPAEANRSAEPLGSIWRALPNGISAASQRHVVSISYTGGSE